MPIKMITRTCEHCGKDFDSPDWKHRQRRFCSKSCSVRWTSAQKFPPPVTMICENPECTAPFTVPEWRVNQGAKYCSRSCAGTVNNEKRKAAK